MSAHRWLFATAGVLLVIACGDPARAPGVPPDLVPGEDGGPVPAPELAKRLLEELAGDAHELGCASHLETVWEVLREGTGARRQLAAWERRHQLDDVVRTLVL